MAKQAAVFALFTFADVSIILGDGFDACEISSWSAAMTACLTRLSSDIGRMP